MLPAEQRPVEPSSRPPATAETAERPLWDPQAPAVLLVEDDAGDALLVEELIADCRPAMTLQWARSMADAQRALAEARPDCVLLDLHLPDAWGLDALATVQQWADGIAVVVLTGLAEEETGLAAVAAGAQDYLVKGHVDADRLGRAVRYAIQRKQTEQAAAALQASQLQAQENARLERGLLPKPLLGVASDLEVVSRYQPGRTQALLGGDFYDVVQSPDDTVHVLIGDVSGHGPDAAALGVALRIAWRTLVLSGVEGAERVRRLEQILDAERTEEHVFATLTCARLLPDRRRVEIIRAGHPGMIVRTRAGTDLVEVDAGPALGIVPGADWPTNELELPEDDWQLLLFTDGLFEGRINAQGDRLGLDGLLAAAQRLPQAGAEELVDALVGHAQALAEESGGLDDDVAVLHLQWSGRS